MKLFLLFVGEQYYPRGGWDDFHRDFDSSEEAIEFVTADPKFRYESDDDWESEIQWAQVVDSTNMKAIHLLSDTLNTTTGHYEKVWSNIV